MIICSNQQSITHLRELNKNCIITGFIKWCRIVCGKIAYCEEAVDHFKMWKRLTSWVNLERLAGLGWLASGWSAEARQLGLPSVVLLWLSGGWLAFSFFWAFEFGIPRLRVLGHMNSLIHTEPDVPDALEAIMKASGLVKWINLDPKSLKSGFQLFGRPEKRRIPAEGRCQPSRQ